MHPPEVGEASGIEALARFGRSTKGLGRLSDVILKQPRIRERAAHLDLLVAPEPRPLLRAYKQRRRICPAPLFERLQGLTEEIRCAHGAESIPRIQGENES